MKSEALDLSPLAQGALILALALGIWSAQQDSSAPETAVPEAGALATQRMPAARLPVIDIPVFDAVSAIAKGATVIDVRSRDTYAEGHIAGAISMPLDELKRRAPEFAAARDTEYIVYCGNGSNLGPQAARALSAAGHPSTRNLAAGYSGWKAAGQATATGLK